MNTKIGDQMLLLRSGGQSSLIKCPKSYDKLLRFLRQRFELGEDEINYLYYLDDEGDIIRVECQEDLDLMIVNNPQTKIICINIKFKIKIGFCENSSNASLQIV